MQIHELNVFNGNLEGNTYVAVDDGKDTGKALLNIILKSLNERIDNIIAGGTAPSEAEVTDARLGADGVEYSSLGTAIRSQIGYLQSDIMPLLKNALVDVALSFVSVDGFYNPQGTFVSYGGVKAATVTVQPGELYFLTSRNYYNVARAVIFDGNGVFISSVYNGNNTDPNELTPVRIPENGSTMIIQQPYSANNPITLSMPDIGKVFANINDTLNSIIDTTSPEFEEVSLTYESATGFYNKDGVFETYDGVTTATIGVDYGDVYYLTSRDYFSAAPAVFFDDNDNFMGSVFIASDATPFTEKKIGIPLGVTKLMIQRLFNFSPTMLYIQTGYKLRDIESVLSGKNITVIGDSITEKNYRANTNWVMWLTSWCGVTFQNLGRSGTGFRAGVNNNNNYFPRIATIQADPDVIGVALSWNDISDQSVVIGTSSDTGTATLAGYANDFFDELISQFPTTPIICYCQGPWSSWHYGVARSNEWIDVLSQICGKHGIPFYYDLYNGGTLKPWLQASREKYFTSDDPDDNPGIVDDVHPNSEGHKVIARYLYPKFAENLVTTGLNYK